MLLVIYSSPTANFNPKDAGIVSSKYSQKGQA